MNKILLAVLLLGIVVASAGGWLFVSQAGLLPKNSSSIISDTVNSASSQATGCESIADKIERKKCFVNECEKKKDNTTNHLQYSSCIYQLISTNKFDSLLDCNLVNITDKGECITSFVRIKKDESICDDANYPSDWKDECYRYVASEKENPTICNKIRIEFNRNVCFRDIASQTKNPAICDNIPDADQIDKEVCLRDAK